MGCEISAFAAAENGTAPSALRRVPRWFETWEQCLSRFRLDSELSILNRSADRPVKVSNTLWEVYELALWADHFTGGLVRPTVGAAIIHAGYDRSFELLPAENIHISLPPEQALDPAAVILADEETRTICLPASIQLDLGGVAKGWAAHKAMQRLSPAGPALVDAGGDIAVSSSLPHGEPWQVAVTDPFDSERELLRLHVGAGGVATSGKDRRRWRQNGQLRHHIIDPRTGLPAESDILRATIVAPSLMEAEAAAKVCVILGSQAGIAWLDARPRLAGLFVLENGQLMCNSAMQEYL
jgi:thiamine biosynthesis lipoprotein